MNLFQRIGQYFADRRTVTAKEHLALSERVKALESSVKGLPVESNDDLRNQLRALKVKVEQLGLRVGFKAGSGIS